MKVFICYKTALLAGEMILNCFAVSVEKCTMSLQTAKSSCFPFFHDFHHLSKLLFLKDILDSGNCKLEVLLNLFHSLPRLCSHKFVSSSSEEEPVIVECYHNVWRQFIPNQLQTSQLNLMALIEFRDFTHVTIFVKSVLFKVLLKQNLPSLSHTSLRMS